MRKVLIKKLAEHVNLYRDPKTGLAWVEDGSTGNGHTAHPSIHASGSVHGMKKLGYWDKSDRTVQSHGFIYNIDTLIITDEYDQIAAEHCRCGGRHGR